MLICRNGTNNGIIAVDYLNGSPYMYNTLINNKWHVYSFVIRSTGYVVYFDKTCNVYSKCSSKNASYSNTYVGKSWWPWDSLAYFDIKEFIFYDYSIPDIDILGIIDGIKTYYNL